VTQSDRVREYCLAHLIEPARARGETTISIRAGDVHAALGFRNRLPLVCSALGTAAFEELARVERVGVDGPLNGANTVFRFRPK
jgi:5-methylcytosine-specific restriction protein B